MVYQFTLDGKLINEYNNPYQAAKQNNISPSRIYEAVKFHYRSHDHYWQTTNVFENYNNIEDTSVLNSFPKIFVFDIETSLMLVDAFGLWDKYTPHDSIHKDWIMLSWAGVYVHDGVMLSDAVTAEEATDGNDKRIVKSLWEHLHNADIVVLHNGIRFDLPKLQVRIMDNELPPYSPIRVIDTLKSIKKIAAHTSNKLDYLTNFYDIGKKIETNRDLWRRCTFGIYGKEDQALALQEMEIYNRMDSDILLDTYLKIRPYIKSHVNLGVYINDNKERCHYCGSDDIQITNDYYTTNVSKFQLYKCNHCGGYTPSRFTSLGIAKRKHLLKSLPIY